MPILISACLCGLNCKYNGANNLHPKIQALMEKEVLIPVCPEQLGGLPTPRSSAEIQEGTGQDVLEGKATVMNKSGDDVTAQFIKGAQESLKLAQLTHCHLAILKSRSPSCGFGLIYDGSFSGKLIPGNGVTAQLLLNNNIKIMQPDDL